MARDQPTGQFHAVRFYADSDELTRIVAEFLTDGFEAGQPAVVLATPGHLAKIGESLRGASIDVSQREASGSLFLLDAEEALARFMVDGMPDPVRFREAIVPVLERANRGRLDCPIRAYGEMVDVLWKRGERVAATRLEILWNSLARLHSFSLLCGYSMGSFYKDGTIEEICSQHSHVVSHGGEYAPLV